MSLREQQLVETLKAVTGIQDTELLVSVLEQNGWDIERATSSLVEDRPSSAVQGPVTTNRTSVLLGPFFFIFKLFTSFLSYSFKTISFLTGANVSSLNAKEASSVFIVEYEKNYGKGPDFFQGSYTQALEFSKKELKYLIAYLHSSENDYTEEFCKNTLNAAEFLQFSQEFCIWGGDISHSEAFQVSNVLGATRFPFCALIALQQSKMLVIDRFEGPIRAEILIEKITRHTARIDVQLATVRRERAEREQARLIRQKQDEAYQASLRADELKFQLQREQQEQERLEKERKERELIEKSRKTEQKLKRIQELKANLKEETSESDPVAKISIRLPNGTRLVRKFLETDRVQDLKDFIEIQDLSPIPLSSDIEIVNTYPRKVLDSLEITLLEAGLVPNASVFVEESVPR